MAYLLTGDTPSGGTRTLLTDQNGILQVAINSGGDTASSTQISNTSANPVPVSFSGGVAVNNFPSTQSVSASSLPLPSGAATSALQTTANTALAQIHTDLTAPLPAGTNAIGSVSVSNFPSTQPVSGTVAISNPQTSVSITGTPSVTATISGTPSVNAAVSNFPSSQAVTNAGTFSVQNTAAVIGGNATAVKVDGSAVTQPISGSV